MLLRKVRIGNGEFDIGSDHHIVAGEQSSYIDEMRKSQRSSTLILAGDIWSNYEGKNTIDGTNEILAALCARYKRVLFVLGNHDARGVRNVWSKLEAPSNLITPYGADPLAVCVEGVRFLLANLFFDKRFLNLDDFGISPNELDDFYNMSPDGKYFYDGNFDLFNQMAENVRTALDPSMEVIVTHALPSPRIISVSASFIPEARREIVTANFDIISDDEIAERLSRYVDSRERALKIWRRKAALMGSDVFSRGVGFRDGIIAIHGHDHTVRDVEKNVDGKNVRFLTFQPRVLNV